jgi:hypothetical protein
MESKKKEQINKRLSYFTKAIKPKEVLLWASDEPDQNTLFGMLVGYLEWSMGINRIDKSIYLNDFNEFYNIEIASKYDGVVPGKEDYTFCSSKMNGGVNEEYIKDVANESLNATILSVSLNPDKSINTVYALVTFRVSESKMAIKIETLCGNQVLPPSGEGSRLMKLLENAGYEFGLHKILLNPVDTAVNFYVDKKYRYLHSNESQETPDSDSDASSHVVMQKNVRAQKRWAKIRTAIKLATIMKKTRNANTRLQLEKKYAKLTKQKEESRPIKINPMTMRERSTRIIPGSSFASNIKVVPKSKPGIPSKVIVPGESFALSNKKAEILDAAATSRKKEVDELLAKLEREKNQRITRSRSKIGKGYAKTKRRF